MSERTLLRLLGLLDEIEQAATRREIHRARREYIAAVRLVLRGLDAARSRRK
jgi:hypothetical protein